MWPPFFLGHPYIWRTTIRHDMELCAYWNFATILLHITHMLYVVIYFNFWWPVQDPHLHLHWSTCSQCHLEQGWGYDNSQCYPPGAKRLVDPVNGTYQTVLTIDPSVGQSDILGTYNCTVENVRGESSETASGKLWTVICSYCVLDAHTPSY